MTAESRKIREGAARGVYFAWGSHQAGNLQQILDWTGKPICAVQVDALIKAFRTALDGFMEASQVDPELGQRVSKRKKRILMNTQLAEEEISGLLRRIDETNR